MILMKVGPCIVMNDIFVYTEIYSCVYIFLKKECEEEMIKKTVWDDQQGHQPPDNPANRPLVTFDSNIVFAARNNEDDVQPIHDLLALNRLQMITVNVTLSTALEEQRSSQPMKTYEYDVWLKEQGIASENIFTHPRTIGFQRSGDPPNTITFDTQLEFEMNMRIHAILFPAIPFRWADFRDQECNRLNITGTKRNAVLELERLDLNLSPSFQSQHSISALDTLEPMEREEVFTVTKRLLGTWVNAKNDSLGLYNHLTLATHTTHPELAVFTTNDKNFFKQSRATALFQLRFPGKILRPAEAVNFLHGVGISLLPEILEENQ